MKDRAVVITSGGLDSTVLCYYASSLYDDLFLLSFNYGQRHKKELNFAKKTAEALNTNFDLVDLKAINGLLAGSALTDDVDVPEGHYAEDNMKLTVVPNRNMIMLSVAIAHAITQEAKVVLAGMHAGDHFVYPDCRAEFIKELNDAAVSGNQGFGVDGFGVVAPFVNSTKSDIVALGDRLGVPFVDTWSCYVGGSMHCGRCGTCVERAEAFHDAGVVDPTRYEDPDYWRLVTRKGS